MDDWTNIGKSNLGVSRIEGEPAVKLDFAIDWARHAESCSNFDQNDFLDKPEATSMISAPSFTKLKAAANYQPNLSFVGMQQAIMLGEAKVIKDSQYDAIFVSPTVRTIMTALMALRGTNYQIYVIPYISEHINIAGTRDYQNNPVDPQRLRRLVAYIKDWLQVNWIKYFDDISVINKLSELKKFFLKENDSNGAKLIDTILNCKENIDKKAYTTKIAYCAYTKKTSTADLCYEDWYKDCVDNITRNILHLSGFVTHHISSGHNELQPYLDFLKQIINPAYIRGPPVDFTYWDKYYNDTIKRNEDINKPQTEIFNQFYTKFLPEYYYDHIWHKPTKAQPYNLLCVTHGSILRGYFGKYMSGTNVPDKAHMFNTQVIHETFTLVETLAQNFEIQNRKTDYYYYVPEKIRVKFPELQSRNIDICRTESLKGMLNYPLWDKSIKDNFIPATTGKIIGMVSNIKPSTYATIDSQILFDPKTGQIPDDLKYYDDSYQQAIIKGGYNDEAYKRKYKKYKLKYFALKKKTNK